MPERAKNRPVYAQIAAHYRDLIMSGELVAGELLPSHKALADEWAVTSATAEKAVSRLKTEGLVRGIVGVGTEVVGSPVSLSSGTQRQERGQRTGSSWGAGERSDSHRANVVPAPSYVADSLAMTPGEHVIRRTRVYRDGHGVVAHSTSWIPAEFAQDVPELLRSERLQGGTSLDLIARATGRRITGRTDETSARIATADDLSLLEQPAGTMAAILVLTSVFMDAQRQPIELGVDLGAPGRTRIDSIDSSDLTQ